MPLIPTVDSWVSQTLACTPLINPYMAITCTSHPKTLLHTRILPIWEVRPRDLRTLTLYLPYKEKSEVHGILISPTPLYKHQASSYLRYAKILLALVSLSYSSITNLTFRGSLASTKLALSIGSSPSCSLGTQLACIWTINSLTILVDHHLPFQLLLLVCSLMHMHGYN